MKTSYKNLYLKHSAIQTLATNLIGIPDIKLLSKGGIAIDVYVNLSHSFKLNLFN